MDVLAISVSLAALILGAAIGWLFARSRFRTTIAELNTNLVLERRVNKQLSEAVQIDAVRNLIHAPGLTMGEPAREPTLSSGQMQRAKGRLDWASGYQNGSARHLLSRIGRVLGAIWPPEMSQERPDGYTLLLVAPPAAINATLYNDLSFNFIRDIAPVAGGPALIDLVGGQVQVMFETTLATLPYIRSGKLRALAVTSATRSATLPDLPTVGEFVPGYEATAWYGLGAPKNTPIEIVAKLNNEVNAGLADPKIKERLADLGGEPISMSPAAFGKLIADETEKWAKVIQTADIRPD